MLAFCDAATLLELKAVSVGWRAKVRALGCSPGLRAGGLLCAGAVIDVTVALASGCNWLLDVELLLRAVPRASMLRAHHTRRRCDVTVDVSEAFGTVREPNLPALPPTLARGAAVT